MDTLQTILLVAPVLLFSVIAHEIAHGYAALKQGDQTALALGRLSWNPIRHIDPFLTILMPLMMWIATRNLPGGPVVLGGAKPVPVDPRNYKNYRSGDIIVSLAGVAANLALAIACTILIVGFGLLGSAAPVTGSSVGIIQAMMITGLRINLVLIAFNLIPIPPLDGSHVVKHLLPPAWALRYQALTRYGLLILIVLLYFGDGLLQLWFRPAIFVIIALQNAVSGFMHPSAQQWLQ